MSSGDGPSVGFVWGVTAIGGIILMRILLWALIITLIVTVVFCWLCWKGYLWVHRSIRDAIREANWWKQLPEENYWKWLGSQFHKFGQWWLRKTEWMRDLWNELDLI